MIAVFAVLAIAASPKGNKANFVEEGITSAVPVGNYVELDGHYNCLVGGSFDTASVSVEALVNTRIGTQVVAVPELDGITEPSGWVYVRYAHGYKYRLVASGGAGNVNVWWTCGRIGA